MQITNGRGLSFHILHQAIQNLISNLLYYYIIFNERGQSMYTCSQVARESRRGQ